MGKLHPVQRKILEIASRYDLQKMGLRKIARLIEELYPQTVKYHISQLRKKGFLDEKLKPKQYKLSIPRRGAESHLVSVPIVGAANCGEANLVAEENLEGFLKVSPKVVGENQEVFVLHAEGDSLNKANIYGRSVEDGDYVLVDASNKTPQSGDYIVSIIDGMANIKKFMRDEENQQIVLVSESTKDYPPPYIFMKMTYLQT